MLEEHSDNPGKLAAKLAIKPNHTKNIRKKCAKNTQKAESKQ